MILIQRRTLLAATAATVALGSVSGCAQSVSAFGRLVAVEAGAAFGMEAGETLAKNAPAILTQAVTELLKRLPSTDVVINYAREKGAGAEKGLRAVLNAAGTNDIFHAVHDNGDQLVTCPAIVTLGLAVYVKKYGGGDVGAADKLRRSAALRIERLEYNDSDAAIDKAHTYMLEMGDKHTIQIRWEPTTTTGQLSTVYVQRGIYKGGAAPDWAESADSSYSYNQVFAT